MRATCTATAPEAVRTFRTYATARTYPVSTPKHPPERQTPQVKRLSTPRICRGVQTQVFSLLQKNVLDRRRWRTREELRIAIVIWIERTYHRRRRQAGLDRLTPIEFEAIMTTPASQAA
ncbi:transposase [Mycolicibacterium hassiacum DSM 44199]|nr:transposase [Mycolicibacterium hassiacum DSM 44199]